MGLGPVVSKIINSDLLEGETGTVGLEVEVEPAGMENPITEDMGRVLRPGPGGVSQGIGKAGMGESTYTIELGDCWY